MVLKIVDKSGRLIHLSSERWSHILKHAGMNNQLDNIKETVEKPTRITKLKFDNKINFYFKYYKDKKSYLMVMIKYLNGNGFNH